MSDSNRTEVTVAHPTFWYIDADGGHRLALRGQTVDVGAEDLDRGEKYGAFVKEGAATADMAPPPVDPVVEDKPESDKVDDIKAWVGTDPAKAQEALAAEQEKNEDDQRSTLVDHLEKLLAGGNA